ncbi:hypothetical protein KUTeg_004786 [Tegillarca granosa]|uniref:Prominin-like protein n=1 Tax=Tegillarca granosa TaxID=220873 RepID=A0ABQ9FHV1_TEGGR|nr:hypothetical protein KUTeg_004786 [Tegillarca granosa]
MVKFQICLAADPTLSQTTVTDSAGNSADENSIVTFASIPTVTSYKASNTSYSSTGLEWYYSLHTLIIDNLVFPDGFPTETINGIIDGTVTKQLIEGYSGLSIFGKFLGYVILIVIGIIFIVIFPLIGGCFCCCRCCCGNCGGDSFQKKEDAENVCKRRTYVVFLLLMIIIICFGMVCVYITNANIGMAVNNFDSTVSDNMDDIESFVNIIVKQVKHIGNTNFNFTQEVINRDLNSIGYIVGIPVRTKLQTDSGILVALQSVLTLADKISGIATALAAVNTQVTVVENAASAFTSFMDILTTLVNDTNAGCSCSGPNMADYALRLDTGNMVGDNLLSLARSSLNTSNYMSYENYRSVFLVFLFSWGLLLLTTLTFAVGTPIKRFVCEPITDTPYATEFSDILDTVIYKAVTGNESGSYIGHVILQNSTANITLSGLLEDCDNNKGIYSVLRLEEQINTTQLTDYKTLNADAMLNDIDNLITALDTLANDGSLSTTLRASIIDVKANLNNSQQYLQANGSTQVTTEVTAFANRLYTVVDYYINDTLYALNYELGACKPVYNAYKYLLRTSVCSYIVDSLRIQDPFGNKVLPDDPPAYTPPRVFTFQEKKGADW